MQMTPDGTMRVAPALALVRVLGDLGHDHAAVLAAAGWPPGLLNNPENLAPFTAFGRLLAVAAMQTGCEHLGLLVGQAAGPSAIGAIGFAARHAPDVRSALELLRCHLVRHNSGAVVTQTVMGNVAMVGYRIYHSEMPGGPHITVGALVVAFQLMKLLCGPQWEPLETSFALHWPGDLRPYHTQFGEAVRFEAEESALSFSAEWLDSKIVGADPELQRVLLRMIGGGEAPQVHSLHTDIRGVLAGMIGNGDVHQDAVARMFGLSSRTLHRRLAALGTSFQALHDEVRCEIACRLLNSTKLPVSQVALMLGYSEASAFTRSFTRRMGCGPATWRSAQRGLGPD